MPRWRLIIIGVISSALLSATIAWLLQRYRSEQDLLAAELVQQTRLQSLTASLVRELGYSGFIHNFKNYILRGEDQYYEAARMNMSRVERLIFESRRQNVEADLSGHYQALFDTISHSKANLELVRTLRAEGLGPIEIDNRVRVDVSSASLALHQIVDNTQTGVRDSIRQVQQHTRNVQKRLALLVGITLLAGVVISLVLAHFVAYYRKSRDALTRLTEKHSLLNAAPNPILVVAESGSIVFANAGAASLFECEPEELTGQPLESLLPDSLRNQHMQFRQLFFDSQGARTMLSPVLLHTRKGNRRNVEVCIGLTQADGRRYAVANLIDVSALAEYRQRLEGLEKKFRTTFEIAPVGIVHLTLDGHLVQVNSHFATMLGYGKVELEGKAVDEVTFADDLPQNSVIVDRLMNQDVDFYRLEQRYLHRDGRLVWGNRVTTLYRDMTGTPQYLISVVEDITQRKQYEQHLLNSERKFKTIAQYVNGVVWMSTPGISKMLYVNEAYERIWQRSRESVYGNPRSFFDAVVPEDRTRVMDELRYHQQGSWKIQYRIERPDGSTCYIEDEGAAVKDDTGDIIYMVGLARDITEEQLLKERLLNTNQHLERLARFDPLTMSIRRQYAHQDLDECIALFKRYKTDATLIFIDLNDFKEVNDCYGHETGDEVLMEFARTVRAFIRQTDAFYRYAGDEFLILLRETSAAEALRVVEKMEQRLPVVEVGLGQPIHITFSCGVISLAVHYCENARDWIRIADEQMYNCKRQRKAQTSPVQ